MPEGKPGPKIDEAPRILELAEKFMKRSPTPGSPVHPPAPGRSRPVTESGRPGV